MDPSNSDKWVFGTLVLKETHGMWCATFRIWSKFSGQSPPSGSGVMKSLTVLPEQAGHVQCSWKYMYVLTTSRQSQISSNTYLRVRLFIHVKSWNNGCNIWTIWDLPWHICCSTRKLSCVWMFSWALPVCLSSQVWSPMSKHKRWHVLNVLKRVLLG